MMLRYLNTHLVWDGSDLIQLNSTFQASTTCYDGACSLDGAVALGVSHECSNNK